METLAVVEAFDATDDIQARLCPCGVTLWVDQFDLQRFEEAFHRGVVPTISTPTHRLRQLVEEAYAARKYAWHRRIHRQSSR